MTDNTGFIEFLRENDPLGLLKDAKSSKPKARRSVLLNNFEEIVDFFEEYHREPNNNSSNIKEFQLYCRLKSIRENPSMVKELKQFDFYDLLHGETVTTLTLEDFLNDDPLNLLSGEFDDSIFELKNVKKSDRIAPEYISRRRFCQNFEKYKLLFDSIHADLEHGNRKLAIYHPEELLPNRFYVLGGIVLYLESVDGNVENYKFKSGERARYDGRTYCIFDNGTTSDMLYRSLDKALQKDGYSITDFNVLPVADANVAENDKVCGFVYVLKSHHTKLKNIPDIYKIGSTTTSVTERIKNAVNEATYLYAGVDVVETYRCYNMGPGELEKKLHAFFDNVRLNINIPDEHGVVISPREWFCVNIETIKEAIDLILTRKEGDYVYDPSSRKIIAKEVKNS